MELILEIAIGVILVFVGVVAFRKRRCCGDD